MPQAWDDRAAPCRVGDARHDRLMTSLIAPFVDYDFMRRALVGCLALAMGCGPVGILLLLRRMSLMGDALSHAVLPGAGAGFVVAGLSLAAMSIGGFVAGLAVALLAGLVTRVTPLREDASFAAFYLTSLALGVLLVSLHGSNVDLLHVLFGSVLAVDDAALILVGCITSVTLIGLTVIYRPLVVECFDPGLPARAGCRRRPLPSDLPGPGGAEPSRLVPGPGHADGRRA